MALRSKLPHLSPCSPMAPSSVTVPSAAQADGLDEGRGLVPGRQNARPAPPCLPTYPPKPAPRRPSPQSA
eukprot:4670694-Pyramimonas_sp.AAC.1